MPPKDGWTDRDAWVESGKDPDDWVSAKKFNERGEMIGQIKSLSKQAKEREKEFERRLDQVNKFNEMQRKRALAEAEATRDRAIEDGDKEAVINAQTQINDLNDVEIEEPDKPKSAYDGPSKEDQSAISTFNRENPWMMEKSPKAAYAQFVFNDYTSAGKSVPEAIELMKSDLAREYPDVNPRREAAPHVPRNSSRPGKVQQRTLKMSDLTHDERVMRNEFFQGVPEEEFLQTVADSRKGV